MDEYDVYQPEHSGLALFLGIIGIMIALFGCLMFGISAGLIVLLLSVGAIALGVKARGATKGRKGMGGIVTGIIAIVLGIFLTGSVWLLGRGIAESIRVQKLDAPILEKYSGYLYMGVAGMVLKANKEVDLNDLQTEMESMNQQLEKNGNNSIGWVISNGVSK